jgi:hypothetical protein
MAEPVGLSAAEAFVLISLPRFNARATLKYGLMGLLAQGILRSEEKARPGIVRIRRLLHLRVAPDLPADLPPLTASLVSVVNAASTRDGVIGEVLKQAMRAYRRTLVGFVLEGVGPALVARGLAEARHRRLLGLIPHTSFHLTSAGEAEKTRLQNALHEARAIPQYLDRDPAQAAALAAAAGGAILLVEELRPHYRQLAKAFEEPDMSPSPFPALVDYGQPDAFHFGCIDFDSIDFGCFDSFDSGFDAASDGSGGDGGTSGC